MRMEDINYVKFGIHLMKTYISSLDNSEEVEIVAQNGIFEIYMDILMNTQELPIIVRIFNIV
jgi:hypothetical protein